MIILNVVAALLISSTLAVPPTVNPKNIIQNDQHIGGTRLPVRAANGPSPKSRKCDVELAACDAETRYLAGVHQDLETRNWTLTHQFHYVMAEILQCEGKLDPVSTSPKLDPEGPPVGALNISSSAPKVYNATDIENCAKVQNCHRDVRDRWRLIYALRELVQSQEDSLEQQMHLLSLCNNPVHANPLGYFRKQRRSPNYVDMASKILAWDAECRSEVNRMKGLEDEAKQALTLANQAEARWYGNRPVQKEAPLANPSPVEKAVSVASLTSSPPQPTAEPGTLSSPPILLSMHGKRDGKKEDVESAWRQFGTCRTELEAGQREVKRAFSSIYALQKTALGNQHPHGRRSVLEDVQVPREAEQTGEPMSNNSTLGHNLVAREQAALPVSRKKYEMVKLGLTRAEDAIRFWKNLYTQNHIELVSKYLEISNKGWYLVDQVRIEAEKAAKASSMGASTITKTTTAFLTHTKTVLDVETVTSFVTQRSTTAASTPTSVSARTSVQTPSPTAAAAFGAASASQAASPAFVIMDFPKPF